MSRNYDRRTVEALLPTLWDEASVWGIRREEVPDPQMPKSKANPAHGNVLAAMMADVSRAWDRCDVPNKERRVLVLHYGMGWTHAQAGFNQGVPHSTALRRAERGVGRITAWLNGDNYDDEQAACEATVQV